MSATQTVPVPLDVNRPHNEIVHFYCCDKNVAWCGSAIANDRDCPEDCGCQPCVVCEHSYYDDCECTA